MPLSIKRPISYGAAVTETQTFRAGRLLLGVLYALIAFAVVVGIAVAVVQVTPAGEGFADLAAFVSVIVLGGGAVLLALLVVGIVFIARGKRDLGTGLLLGFLLGIAGGVAALFPHLIS